MKNRLVFPLFSILLVSLLFSPNAFSEDTVVRVASHVWVSDTPQIVDIVIENGQNVAGYQVKLQFNSDRIEYVGIDHGDYLPNDAFFGELQIIDDDPKDSLKVLLFAATSFTGESNGDGTLATLEFKQKGAGSPLTLLDETFLSNRAGEASFPKLEHSKTRPHVVRDLAVRSVQARPQNTTEAERHHYNIKEAFELRATVKNVGNRESASPKLQLYGPTSTATIKGSRLGSPVNIEPLEPNSAVEISLPDLVTAPEVPGNYYYTVCIEGYEGWTAPESGVDVTDNNCYTLEITVGIPNIVIDSVAVDPVTVFPGETFDLSATVKNEGEISSTTLRFYGPATASTINDLLPTDFTDKALRETVNITSLPPNGISKSTITVTAPVVPRPYYYGVSVESGPNETNNRLSVVKITVQPPVNIPDSNLLKVIEAKLKKPGATITPTDMQTIKILNAANNGITELTGLESAINLEVLDLSNNNTSNNISMDVNPLAGLTKLKKLDISDNNISDVSPLAGLINLKELHLDNNPISDMSALAGLKNLTLHFNKHYKTINEYGSTVYCYPDGNKAVLVKGMELSWSRVWKNGKWVWENRMPDFSDPNLDYTNNLPDKNGEPFKIYGQPNNHTCGHTSALMLLHYYGVKLGSKQNGINTFDKLARGSSPNEFHCRDIVHSVYPNDIKVDINLTANINFLDFDLSPSILCAELIARGVHKIAPGTLPHEEAIGLKKIFPFPTEVRNGNGNIGDQKTFLEDQVSQSCPPIIFLKLKGLFFHWVVVVGYDTKADEFLIADPSPKNNGKFKWWEWTQQPACGPALEEAWGLNYNGDPACSTIAAWEWNLGGQGANILSQAGIQYFAVFPTVAPPYHHLESQTFEITINGTGIWILRENGAAKVIACEWSLIDKEETGASVTWTNDKVTVSGEEGVKMFLTVYYEGVPSWIVPRAPSIAFSAPSINTSLLPNYPNPFNPETWIPYQLAEPADVALTIYDIQGRVVRDLDLGHQRAGVYQSRARAAHWDGRNAHGEPVASGLYFYTLKAGDFTATRKMLIRK